MGLDLAIIAVFIGIGLVYMTFVPGRWRAWLLLILSVCAVYALQPALPVRFSDFVLPTAAIALTLLCWWATRQPEQTLTRQDALTLALIATLIVGMSLFRFVDAEYRLTPSRPPDPPTVIAALAGVALVLLAVRRGGRWLIPTLFIALVGLFVLLKTEPLATELSRLWRGQTGQDVTLASAIDWNWLGFSYLAFRLIHTLRDRQSGLLPTLSLRDYVVYALFFPAYTAGPIDRAERFQQDLRTPSSPNPFSLKAKENQTLVNAPAHGQGFPAQLADGGARIAMGLFKKFVIVDTLAAGMTLTPVNAEQAVSAPALWLLLYGYGLRLFFDFSGYTDIAIGIGILFGIRLPENFDRPYLKTDITRFWQSWHKTLSDWARFYVFSPLSRYLLMRKPKPSPLLIVFSTQMATMITIGLWHGVAGGFLMWGIWHGVGLFMHKLWSDRTRAWYRAHTPTQRRLWQACAWLLTFHFVMLGWVWFALPNGGLALQTFGRLFGMGW
jgi:alginate O-acetyltransferase complex protein AlgI